MRIASVLAATISLAAVAATPTVQGPVPVKVSLAVGGAERTGSAPGQCRHEANASIYGVRAALWSVQYSAGAGAALRQLSLTVWRPAAGGDAQMTLLATDKAGAHRIDTVKGSKALGSGTVSVQPQGAGARFDIDGRAADGATIRGTVSCPRLGGIEAVGG